MNVLLLVVALATHVDAPKADLPTVAAADAAAAAVVAVVGEVAPASAAVLDVAVVGEVASMSAAVLPAGGVLPRAAGATAARQDRGGGRPWRRSGGQRTDRAFQGAGAVGCRRASRHRWMRGHADMLCPRTGQGNGIKGGRDLLERDGGG